MLNGFALLGESQHAIECFDRCRAHERIHAATAARDTAAAGMEDDEAFAIRGQRSCQRPLCLMGRETRGTGPIRLVAIRVTDEHALPTTAGFQMAVIHRLGQQGAHHFAAPVERIHGFEQRRDIDSDLAGTLVVGLRPARQKQRRQHVIRAATTAHDEVADGVGTVAMPTLHHRFEHAERALAERIELRTRPHVARERLGEPRSPVGRRTREPLGIVQPLRQHLMMDAGVLPDIERRDVKAESIDPAQESLDVEEPSIRSLVRAQTLGDQVDVRAKLLDVGVSIRAPVVAVTQTLANLSKEHAIRHSIMPRRCGRPRAR